MNMFVSIFLVEGFIFSAGLPSFQFCDIVDECSCGMFKALSPAQTVVCGCRHDVRPCYTAL